MARPPKSRSASSPEPSAGELQLLRVLWQRGGATVREGRARLASYWGPRLDGFAPNAFGLEEIQPVPDGVQLDYMSHEGLPVRMVFSFTADGKILRTHCAPVAQPIRQETPSVQDRAV